MAMHAPNRGSPSPTKISKNQIKSSRDTAGNRGGVRSRSENMAKVLMSRLKFTSSVPVSTMHEHQTVEKLRNGNLSVCFYGRTTK
ncbi:hypothetical protein OUZ56_001546 [Daphnia magna]|uniref:Uncharacterized protein n=1 Tax=Daphnia magna TaxID=35525 RepID=A0ABR0A305_9CRUS|nr:hypothetical protein OUZ56_001546 [Daphnia magna]